MDAGRNASIIGRNKASYILNATCRGGFLKTRPAFNQHILRFTSSADRDWFRDKNVQGAETYQPETGGRVVIASVGGRIFKIDPEKNLGPNVTNISPSGANPTNRRHAWMVQAEKYFVIQDGASPAIIYDGATTRRANIGNPNYEVPTGRMMAYGLGRLVVVKPGGREYVIGDLVNSGREVIQFTENNFLAEGGAVTVPIPGMITAVKFTAVLDTSVGQGELVVFTDQGASTARVGENRATWKNIQFQRTALLKNGASSQYSVVLVNGDLFFRAQDGIRSLALAQRDFQSEWATTPISRELEPILALDDQGLLDYAGAVLFDNRLLMLVNQARLQNGCYHRALVALDFDLIGSIGEKLPPAYDGEWTGLRAAAIVAGKFGQGERCFCFHRNSEGKNEFWEITRMGLFDNDDPVAGRIPCAVETRSMSYEKPFDLKKLAGGEVWVDSLSGQVDFDVRYRPDQHPCWQTWHSWSETAAYRDCSVGASGCMTVHNYRPQYRTHMQFPEPPEACETGDNKPMRLGYEHQLRLAWTGHARVRALRVHAHEQEERAFGCAPTNASREIECCDIDPLAYLLTGAPNTVS